MHGKGLHDLAALPENLPRQVVLGPLLVQDFPAHPALISRRRCPCYDSACYVHAHAFRTFPRRLSTVEAC